MDMPAIVNTGRPDEGVDYRRPVRPVFPGGSTLPGPS